MSLFFLLNNLHFALEVLGALAFLIVAWLAFDAFRVRRDFLIASRGLGFLLLSLWQVAHALNIALLEAAYAAFAVYILGLIFVLWGFFLERPAPRPKFEAILILPSIAAATFYVNIAAAVLYSAAALLTFRQYRLEFKRALIPFWLSFGFLAVGAAFAAFSGQESLGTFWIAGHVFEFLGFGALVWWVWQYLQLRIREEMTLIFVSAALFISIAVTLAFSIILVNQMENSARADLLTNAKVLDLYIGQLKEEALAKTKFLARATTMADLLAQGKFSELETLAVKTLSTEKLAFLTIVDEKGEVVLRAAAPTQTGDNLAEDATVVSALAGRDAVDIASSPVEKFSVRAASPLTREVDTREGKRTITKKETVGAVVAGFLLDNALADNLKRITGLEASIVDGDTVVATTLFNPDGRTRSTGIKVTDSEVVSKVLGGGEGLTLRAEILSRPFLASYLPIKNSEGEIIGALSSLKPQREILALADSTNRLTLLTVAILMLVLTVPVYFVTRRLAQEI